jgi:hypothetical protein
MVQTAGERAAPLLRVVLTVPIVVAAALVSLAARVAGAVARATAAVVEALTPQIVVAGVAAVCAAALGISQFVHYTGVAVDAPGYEGRIGTVAPVPVAAIKDAGSAHAYVLLPVAALALALTLFALRGNWRVARLVAVCGLVGVVVSLAIDLPKGLDAGTAGIAYSGAEARLSDGFYAELAASSMLVVTGILLSTLLRRLSPAAQRRRERPRRPKRSALRAGSGLLARPDRGAGA